MRINLKYFYANGNYSAMDNRYATKEYDRHDTIGKKEIIDTDFFIILQQFFHIRII